MQRAEVSLCLKKKICFSFQGSVGEVLSSVGAAQDFLNTNTSQIVKTVSGGTSHMSLKKCAPCGLLMPEVAHSFSVGAKREGATQKACAVSGNSGLIGSTSRVLITFIVFSGAYMYIVKKIIIKNSAHDMHVKYKNIYIY